MKLFGADSDHEAMNGGEVMRRLELGYYVSLRHSSIRPDLRTILQDLHQKASGIMIISSTRRMERRRFFIKAA